MAGRKSKNYTDARTLPADRLVQSVGVGLLATKQRLDALDPNLWYAQWKEVVDELEVYSSLLAAFYLLYEDELEGMEVELPSNVVAVTVPNPFYKPKRKAPVDEEAGADSVDLDDLPF